MVERFAYRVTTALRSVVTRFGPDLRSINQLFTVWTTD